MGKFCPAAFLMVFIIGAYSQNINIQYTIQNFLVAPNFQFTQMVTMKSGQPFIRAMETAADTDKAFQFTIEYYKQIGYLVIGVNGLWANAPRDNTTYEIRNGGTDITGVSSYIPADGDKVLVNFTFA